MLTAMQVGRHKVASALLHVREILLTAGVTTSVCLDRASAQDIHDIISTIDRLVGDILPNQKVERS